MDAEGGGDEDGKEGARLMGDGRGSLRGGWEQVHRRTFLTEQWM